MVAAVVGVVLLIGGAVTAVALSSGGSSPSVSPSPTPSDPPSSSTTPSGGTTTAPTGAVDAKPAPKVVSGYRAVSFTVSPGPHGEQAQWRAGSGADWKPVTKQALTLPTAMGAEQACATFRYVAAEGSATPGPSVRSCGRSQRPTIDFTRTTHRCTSAAYAGYDCWYYDVVASGFRSGTSPRALVFLPNGDPFCQCVFHRIDIGDDGRGRQSGTDGRPGEWQVPSTIRRVVVEIAGVRQTIEL